MGLKKISYISVFALSVLGIKSTEVKALDLDYDAYFVGFGSYINDDSRDNNFDGFVEAKGSLSLSEEIDENIVLGLNVGIDSTFNDNFLERNPDTIEELYLFADIQNVRIEVGRIQDISAKMMLSAPDVGLLSINKSNAYQLIKVPDGFAIIDNIAGDFGEEKTGLNIAYKSGDMKYGFNFSNGNKDFNDEYGISEEDFNHSVSFAGKKDWFVSNKLQGALVASIMFADDTNVNGYSKASHRIETSVGTNVNYKNLVFGAGYRFVDESSPVNFSYEGNAWNYGVAYSFGSYEASFSVHNSEAEGDVANSLNDNSDLKMFSLNYKLNKITSLSGSIGRVIYNEESGIKSNGEFFGFGLKMKFRDTIDLSDSELFESDETSYNKKETYNENDYPDDEYYDDEYNSKSEVNNFFE